MAGSTPHSRKIAGFTLAASFLIFSGVCRAAITDIASAQAIESPSCAPDAHTLCLNNGRFQVSAVWEILDPTSRATAVALTEDTGYFWFFDQKNIELVVKVLDGCDVNQHFWVFAAGLTNVDVTLTVTDVLTGTTNTYHNPLGNPFAPVQDTSAFGPCVQAAPVQN